VIIADTNLIAYLLIPGHKTAAAEQVYAQDSNWKAPQLWRSELRNVLMLYVRKAHMTVDMAIQVMALAERKMGQGVPTASADVLRLANQSGCSAYDCEFVALAKSHRAPLVTSDKKLLAAFPDLTISPERFVSRPV